MQEIREHVELLSHQAERWQQDHTDAMLCRQTEWLASVAVHLWASVKDMAQRHPIDPDGPKADEQTAAAWNIYQTLNHAMALIEGIAKLDMAKGYQLDGWPEFMTARREVATAVAVPFEKTLRGLRDLSAGRVKSMGDVRRELQVRLLR